MTDVKRCIVIGGGWAGVSSALRCRKAGLEVTVLEKTDLLLGLGNVGGIMRNNGRYTAAEENIAMGANELFDITDGLATHRNVDFEGHKHAWFYHVLKVEPRVRELLKEEGIHVRFMARCVDVEKTGDAINKVRLADGHWLEGDVFVDATGSTGPMGNCVVNGNGCSMCILRCPTFGPRVSISAKAGTIDLMATRSGGMNGAFSGSCKLEKSTLSKELQRALNKKGVAVVPLPSNLVKKEKLGLKVCKQYALDAFAENIILIDTGYAKMMTPYFNLEELRSVKGFENVRFADPYGGGKGNSIRYMAVAPRDEYFRVKGVSNLFCCGEKSGFFVGHTEAISTGAMAGFNAARLAKGEAMMALPEETAIGYLFAEGQRLLEEKDGTSRRLTFAGGEFFERMKARGLYTTDKKEIGKRIESLGLRNIYKEG